MNRNPRPLTEEALNKEFTIKLRRRDILVLVNAVKQQNYDLQSAAALLDAITVFNSALVLTDKDYVSDAPEVAVN